MQVKKHLNCSLIYQFETTIHLCCCISSAWTLTSRRRWEFGDKGAHTQVCFIDQAQDGRKPMNMRMNNALDWEKGNRSAEVVRWIQEATEGCQGAKRLCCVGRNYISWLLESPEHIRVTAFYMLTGWLQVNSFFAPNISCVFSSSVFHCEYRWILRHGPLDTWM